MTQHDKLIERIRASPPEADFNDVRRLLEAFGWTLDRQRGSHTFFKKPGERTIGIPLRHGRKVKRVYLAQIIERLELMTNHEEHN